MDRESARTAAPARSGSPRLAQLEQCQERDRLLDPRQLGRLLVEVEAPAPPQERAEALEELHDRREAEAHVGERDVGRRRRERAERSRERLRRLRRDLRLGRGRERRRAEAEVAVVLRRQPVEQPAGRLLDLPELLEPPGELLGRLVRVEVGEVDLLLGEELARLQLEQRADEHEELPARVEIQPVPLG